MISFKIWRNTVKAILRLQIYIYVGFGLRLTHYAIVFRLTSSHQCSEENLTQLIITQHSYEFNCGLGIFKISF